MMTPVATVAAIYDAFGRGDVRFILSCLADELRSFSVNKLFDGGSSVVAWISISWVWKATGRLFSDAVALHLWEFDSAGKVTRFFHVEDLHAMWLATVSK